MLIYAAHKNILWKIHGAVDRKFINSEIMYTKDQCLGVLENLSENSGPQSVITMNYYWIYFNLFNVS